MSKKFYLKDWHGKEQEFEQDKIFVRGENGELIQFTQGEGDKPAVVQPLEVTESGTYTAPDGVDGYSPVTVNVQGGDGGMSAGAYWSYGEYAPPNLFSQTWFMYNGELYAWTGTMANASNNYHMYKLVNGVWSQIITSGELLPLGGPISWSTIEFNGKIHMIGCEKNNHRVFDGTAITELGTLPNYIASNGAFVQDNKLKAYSYKGGIVYVWDESTDTWTAEATIGSGSYDYRYFATCGEDVYYNKSKDIYKYENGSSIKVATMPWSPTYTVAYNSCIYCVYNNSVASQGKYRSEWYKYNPATGTETFLGYGPFSGSTRFPIVLPNRLYWLVGTTGTTINIGSLHEVTE